MAYLCELNPGHQVYLDNQGHQTIITTTMGQPGQQQQASSSMTTGGWTAPPQAYQSPGGAVFKLLTTQGEVYISVHGSSVSMTGAVTPVAGAQPLSMQPTTAVPTPPMQPMQPMTMGNMQMTMNPMEMRMGTMELKMESASQPPAAPQVKTSTSATSTSATSASATSGSTRQFCSQCGTKVAPEDRFCSNCGHALG
ncbi:zinc ribbon domain-containing protein [Leptothoe sp. PORK10 BA2]|uniref:zinc ribbon domain-containing protein n=1 Tax=Leptothoe sp. PORK10 BA2 TaxID=3110254 RepID=UPI002B21B3D8|nr:zinc ribbon domain-containing protein [Leptothoe sp. PORK10 BA2]MEA5463529.1 zinc ribbon domain-containing protein [Leptothoe sp. PORK10 BA2]